MIELQSSRDRWKKEMLRLRTKVILNLKYSTPLLCKQMQVPTMEGFENVEYFLYPSSLPS